MIRKKLLSKLTTEFCAIKLSAEGVAEKLQARALKECSSLCWAYGQTTSSNFDFRQQMS